MGRPTTPTATSSSTPPRAEFRPATIERESTPGQAVVRIASGPITELHLTFTPRADESPRALAHRVAEAMATAKATMVRGLAFGHVATQPEFNRALKDALEDPDFTLTWVEGASCADRAIAGIQLWAIAGTTVHTLANSPAGLTRVWDDAAATHCVVSNLQPVHLPAARATQASEALEQLLATLIRAGLSIKDLARTWFFLDGILDWYGDFNRVRNDFFARNELRTGSIPASTAVSGVNPARTALAATAWAIKPRGVDLRPRHMTVASPLQGPAPAYGSAFSRAVEVRGVGYRQLLVSGTASITPEGKTAHVGDVAKQIELTMQVVAALLTSRQMSWGDVTRATAYFKTATDAPHFTAWLKQHDLTALPVIFAQCDICRDDLLFEIEVDAICSG